MPRERLTEDVAEEDLSLLTQLGKQLLLDEAHDSLVWFRGSWDLGALRDEVVGRSREKRLSHLAEELLDQHRCEMRVLI